MKGKTVLRLYVSGMSPSSQRLIANLRDILQKELEKPPVLEVLDVISQPRLTKQAKIMATPTLEKFLPAPAKRVIGDLRDRDKILMALDLIIEREEG